MNQTFLLPQQFSEGNGDLLSSNIVFTSIDLHQRLVFSHFSLSGKNVITRDSVNFSSLVEPSSDVVIHIL